MILYDSGKLLYMKIIDSKTHGVLDYTVGLALLMTPLAGGFAGDNTAANVLMVCGFSPFLYALLTDYELGAFKVISYQLHLVIDLISGVFLALSPWLLGFKKRVFLPHLLWGLGELLVVALSKQVAYTA